MWRRLAVLALTACGDPPEGPSDGPRTCEGSGAACTSVAACRSGVTTCDGCAAAEPIAGACGAGGTCRDGLCTATSEQGLANPIAGAGAFGAAVAFDGRIVVGAPGDERAHVVEPGETGFAVAQTLASEFGAAGTLFGAAVAIAGDLAAVGAPRSTGTGAPNDAAGAVIIFERDPAANTWLETAQILGPDGGGFGGAVALSGTRLVVGADRAGDGAVYVYDRASPTVWTPSARIPAEPGARRFGHAVALQGER
ncbi:MAG: hypothetical protein KIT31_27680, partial [Deltaproteobacteria bacterium]|nr:hypothetical protein [Deltaproteobacteria bacterium]